MCSWRERDRARRKEGRREARYGRSVAVGYGAAEEEEQAADGRKITNECHSWGIHDDCRGPTYNFYSCYIATMYDGRRLHPGLDS